MQISGHDPAAIDIFPLPLTPSLLKQAEEVSQEDGIDLNQFINVAVAEKLSRLQHDRWVASRRKPDAARTARALAILDRDDGNEPDPGDELPEGYVSIRFSTEYKKAAGME